ncbi:MAG: transporter ATP-binding protein [Haloplasmataceae bacterium]|jgi:ABC-type multidrug transport system ATPase subunit|nr:transporter ATP-binding protein [Haloplasmataceae bacterium]
MLELKHIVKSYQEHKVLDDVSLIFENGVYGLLAPNGAGKTTLLKIITTLLFPDSGELYYNGQDIYILDEDYRDILGFLPQDFGYYKDYSVHKFLKYIGVLKGLKGQTLENRICEVLEIVELTDNKKIKMKKLSGGMKQRVGIAQALLNNPKLLILDEPTATLDISQRVTFKRILSKIALNATVIVSTHIVSDIESIANEFILIKNCKIFFKGKYQGLVSQYQDMVWVTQIELSKIDQFENQNFVINKVLNNDYIEVRFLSTEEPKCVAKKVQPNLEDIFLYIFNYKRG